MRVFALGASFMAMSGCSLFWGLDGLGGGACQGDCADGASYPLDSAIDEPPGADTTIDDAPPPIDTGSLQETGPGADSSGVGVDAGSADDAGSAGDAGDASDAPDALEASCTPPTPPTLNDCTALLPLPAAPVIDGVLDCGIPLWPMPVAGLTGPGALPPTVQAALAIGWRPGGLYVFVHVTGAGATRYPPPAGDGQWCGDAVELFADDDGAFTSPPSYDDPGTIQLIAEAPSNAMSTNKTGEMFRDGNDLGAWTGTFVTVRTSDGFDAEAFVVASDLGLSSWSLAQGGKVGLDVAIDLGDPSNQTSTCPRLTQFTIQALVTDAACDHAACNVYEFCAPRLDP